MRDPKRKCRDYERPWRDYCIDKNLDDDWLERLNDLNVFDLINICEGHPQRVKTTATRYPQIYIKLKDKYLRDLVKDWEAIRPTLLKEIHHLFQDGKTHLNFDLNFKLRTGRGRLVYQEGLRLKIRANQVRDASGMDRDIRAWFDTCVTGIEILDRITYEHLTSSTPVP